jgi:hypothetical protein
MCMLELYCGKVPGKQRFSNPEMLRPSPLNNQNQPIEVFSHWHSFQTSFGSLDRLPLQPCLRSRKVYQGGRDEGHLQRVTFESPWSIVSCTYERPYVGMQYCIKRDLCVMEIRSGITEEYILISNWPLTYLCWHMQKHQERNPLDICVIYLENKEIYRIFKTCYIICVLFSFNCFFLFRNFMFFSSNNTLFSFEVILTVHRRYYVEIKCQLDATDEFFLLLLLLS